MPNDDGLSDDADVGEDHDNRCRDERHNLAVPRIRSFDSTPRAYFVCSIMDMLEQCFWALEELFKRQAKRGCLAEYVCVT